MQEAAAGGSDGLSDGSTDGQYGIFHERKRRGILPSGQEFPDRRDGAGLPCAWNRCQCVDSQQKRSDETVKQLESRRYFHEFPGSRKRTGTGKIKKFLPYCSEQA